MGHPRRTPSVPPRPSSTHSISNAHTTRAQRHSRHRSNSVLAQSQPDFQTPAASPSNPGMSPASRYAHNLKVLRRRDPSIVSIFDQFSHVCVYHHNGNKWEKHGFEGSMFLYERSAYPPYGFYILNRMGMDDYIQRLYPEDVIGAHGTYLMMRTYPEFTARRLATAKSLLLDSNYAYDENVPGEGDKFSPIYAIPEPEKLLDKDKGSSQTVGLWMFATDAREPLIDVILRLHSYIKRNVPYPTEFHYGPDRPPPPNPHLRTTGVVTDGLGTQTIASEQIEDSPPPDNTPQHSQPTNIHSANGVDSNGVSELDILFARLGPARSPLGSTTAVVPTPTLPLTHRPSPPSSPSNPLLAPMITKTSTQQPSCRPPTSTSIVRSSFPPARPVDHVQSTSKMTIESLFAALGGTELASSALPLQGPILTMPSMAVFPTTPSTTASNSTHSLALLDSMFASVSESYAIGPQDPFTFPRRHAHIPLRSPSSQGLSGVDAHHQQADWFANSLQRTLARESQRTVSTIHSPTPTSPPLPQILTEEVISTLLGLPLASSPSISTVYRTGWSGIRDEKKKDEDSEFDVHGCFKRHRDTYEHNGNGSEDCLANTKGPGGEVNGDVTPRPPAKSSVNRLGPAVLGPVSLTTSQGPDPNVEPRRPLIPFETDSLIWPYPPLRTHEKFHSEHDGNCVEEDDADIIELDFADTSALNDIDAWQQMRGTPVKQWKNNDQVDREVSHGTINREISWNGNRENEGDESENGRAYKDTRGKKGRRQSEQGKEGKEGKEGKKTQSERGWDPPAPSPTGTPSDSRPIKTPSATKPLESLRGKNDYLGIEVRNETTKDGKPERNVASTSGNINTAAVKESIVSNLLAHGQHAKRTAAIKGRSEFVRELLTLINTDKTFVDGLWETYTDQLY